MIGIITYHFVYNYGAALQAFALQKYIYNKGKDCCIINYIPDKIANAYHIKGRDYLSPRKVLLRLYRARQYKLFELFNRFYLSKGEPKCADLKKTCMNYSILITGSDQVWNLELNGYDYNYFLDFANDNQKRIAYAASVGNNELFINNFERIKEYLNKFSAISFREEITCSEVEQVFEFDCGIKAVVDPVFLIRADEWRLYEIKPKTYIPEKYILFYALTESEVLEKKTIELSKRSGIPIISVHPLCKKWKFGCRNLNNVGPMEFLWLVDHAQFVCTNSYHGTAFSIIFDKSFLPYAHEKLGDRNKQLLKWLNISQEKFGCLIDTKACNKEYLAHCIYESEEFIVRNICQAIE